jgi:hypothetical protein
MLKLLLIIVGLGSTKPSRIPVKIVQTTSTPYVDTSRAASTPTPHRSPNVFSGPAALKPLSTQCISTTAANYVYTVCPYANVTQKESVTTWAPFFGFLGIWDSWETEVQPSLSSDTIKYVRQLYTDGTLCGTKRRSLRLTIVCASGTEYSITDISEPNTCEYTMTLTAPEACAVQFIETARPSALSNASNGPKPHAASSPGASAPQLSSLATPTGEVLPLAVISALPSVFSMMATPPSIISASANLSIAESGLSATISPGATSLPAHAPAELKTAGVAVSSNAGGQFCAELSKELQIVQQSLSRLSQLALACPLHERLHQTQQTTDDELTHCSAERCG